MTETDRQESWTGSCQCGSVRYELNLQPSEFYVCHFLKCRRQLASAFGTSAVVAEGGVTLTREEPRFWSRSTVNGDTLERVFCETCGSRLWHHSVRNRTISIKGGSMDEPLDLRLATHIWTSRMLPGVVIPGGVQTFPEEPTPPSQAGTGSSGRHSSP